MSKKREETPSLLNDILSSKRKKPKGASEEAGKSPQSVAEERVPPHPAETREQQEEKQVLTNAERRKARQGHYDLPAGMKDEIAELAEEHGTTASQIVSLLLADGLRRLHAQEIDLDAYKRESPSIRYKYTLDVEYTPKQ